jgi:cytochrome b pre-mRNA-processing protein 3
LLAQVRQWFTPQPQRAAQEAYVALVTQARTPALYGAMGIPDTLDGRFEAILLHLFLVQRRLGPEAAEFSRLLNEAFIADMDRSLREMGVGDTGVSKRIKAMAQALLGRLGGYAASFDDPAAFREALRRNAFGTVEGMVAQVEALNAYARGLAEVLEGQEPGEILLGRIRF